MRWTLGASACAIRKFDIFRIIEQDIAKRQSALADVARAGELPKDLQGIVEDARQELHIRAQLDGEYLQDDERDRLEKLLSLLEAEYDWPAELKAARDPWKPGGGGVAIRSVELLAVRLSSRENTQYVEGVLAPINGEPKPPHPDTETILLWIGVCEAPHVSVAGLGIPFESPHDPPPYRRVQPSDFALPGRGPVDL